jgi:hypothetical protein
MKFLLFFVIATSYIIGLFLFGKNTQSKKDYLVYWVKSSLFTGLTLDVFLTYVELYENTNSTEYADFINVLSLLATGYIFSFTGALVIIGGLIYMYEIRINKG